MVRLNRIYTGTGDDGTTGLVTGSRVPKTHPRVAAMGSVDELNAALGVALAALPLADTLRQDLTAIQNDLFDVGADLATSPSGDGEEMEGALRVTADQVRWLETRIDAVNEALAPLTSFILPAGGGGAAALHLARAIARRAERDVWALREAEGEAEGETAVSTALATYLNRLSDFLFVAARSQALASGGEVLWQPGAGRAR